MSVRLEDNLRSLRMRGHLVDTTLICKEDKRLQAHMVILFAKSDYFRIRMDTKTFLFLDFDIESVGIAIDYLYTGRLIFSMNADAVRTREVMTIGRNLEVQGLVDDCLRQLANSTNYLELYNLSVEYNSAEVVSSISTSLAADFDKLIKTDEFVNLDLDLLKGILKNDKLETASMDNMVEGILRWIQFDPARKIMLRNLIPLIDLHRLSDGYLNTVLTHDIVEEDHHILTLLLREKLKRTDKRLEDASHDQPPIRRFFNAMKNVWMPKLSSLSFGVCMKPCECWPRSTKGYFSSSIDESNVDGV